MPLPSWPSDVPYAFQDDGGSPIQRALPPIATEMEGGNQRQRPRPGDDVSTIAQTIVMTNAQFATFTTWWKDTLNLGTARFTAPVWTGTAYVTKTCMFAPDGKPEDSFKVNDAVAVSMKLRVSNL